MRPRQPPGWRRYNFLKMRLDIFLKQSRLIPRRSLAQEFCDAGLVRVNGSAAKSSKDIGANDEIEISRGQRRTRLRVLQIPAKKQVAKNEAAGLYEVIEETNEDTLF
jgi:ribosomal 50S subunit-recycling heat shock protein